MLFLIGPRQYHIVGMALQYKQIEQQDAAIKSQTMLNQAEAAKALAEAGKTAGPEYNKATWEAKNLEIENRIKTIAEGITSQPHRIGSKRTKSSSRME